MKSIMQSTTLALMVCVLCACQPIASRTIYPTRIPAEQHLVPAGAAHSTRLGRPLLAGDQAPDFRLVSATGALVHLTAELKAGGPVVLIFYSGSFCRLCLDVLRALDAQRAAFQASGARLIALASQTPAEAAATASDAGLQYAVLADTQAQVARQYGVHPLLPGRTKVNQSPVSVFIVAPSGVILWTGSGLANSQPAVEIVLAQLPN